MTGTARTTLTVSIVRRIPLFLFVAAALLATFFAGMYVQRSRVFPYPLVYSAYKTLAVNLAFRGLPPPPIGANLFWPHPK